jgi:IS1 family transposase
MKSETPQTDAQVEENVLEDKNHPHTDWAPASFARHIERENQWLRAQIVALHRTIDQVRNTSAYRDLVADE